MFRPILKYTPLLKRFLTFLLCFFVLFFISVRPVVASANSVVLDPSNSFVNIATNYQDVIQVAPYLVPIILLLVGTQWWYVNSEDLADKAMDIYNNASDSFRAWANNVAQDIIDGTSAFKLTESVSTEFNNHVGNGNKVPDDKKYIYLPPDLLSLSSVSPDDVLLSDLSDSIDENNSLITQSNYILSGIIDLFLPRKRRIHGSSQKITNTG